MNEQSEALISEEVERRLRDPAKLLPILANYARRLEEAAPKVEAFDALMRSENTMSISETAKLFNLHPILQVMTYLRIRGYLTQKSLPSQAAIDAHYLVERKNFNRLNGKTYSQAVVSNAHLDIWRNRVVPQILEWWEGQE